MSIPKTLAPAVPQAFKRRLTRFDPKLMAGFNCITERWEIYRKDRSGNYQWVIAVENDDESYRPLDDRIFKRLYHMDIIARYGSVANYEKHMDEKQKKWRAEQDKKDDHELREEFKEDRFLWQRAAENAQSGLVNPPPEEKSKKVFSYSKEAI